MAPKIAKVLARLKNPSDLSQWGSAFSKMFISRLVNERI